MIDEEELDYVLDIYKKVNESLKNNDLTRIELSALQSKLGQVKTFMYRDTGLELNITWNPHEGKYIIAGKNFVSKLALLVLDNYNYFKDSGQLK